MIPPAHLPAVDDHRDRLIADLGLDPRCYPAARGGRHGASPRGPPGEIAQAAQLCAYMRIVPMPGGLVPSTPEIARSLGCTHSTVVKMSNRWMDEAYTRRLQVAVNGGGLLTPPPPA